MRANLTMRISVEHSSLAVGVDVGGSSIKCALIDLDARGSFRGRALQHADAGARTRLDACSTHWTRVVANIPGDHAVGLAFPSVIRDGIVRTAANLNKAWIGQPLRGWPPST